MPVPRHFFKACEEAADATRRNRLAIVQIADLCAGSRREIAASYALLRELQPLPGATPGVNGRR
jgi:hypothetical protein